MRVVNFGWLLEFNLLPILFGLLKVHHSVEMVCQLISMVMVGLELKNTDVVLI